MMKEPTHMNCQFRPDTEPDPWWNPVDTDGNDAQKEYNCDRPVYTDSRCVFHTHDESRSQSDLQTAIESESDIIEYGFFNGVCFGDTDLSGSVFCHCSFDGAEFTDANLNYTDFENCSLRQANFNKQSLRDVEFINCDLRKADFDRTECTRVTFEKSDLTRATLARSRFTETVELNDSEFHSTNLTGLTVDKSVINGYASVYESDDWQKASRDYRGWSNVAKKNAFPTIGRELYISHKHAKRKAQSGFARVRAEGSRWLMLYGESIWRILAWSSAVIFVASVLYWIETLREGVNPACTTGFECLYFSTVTFVTLGYGDLSPNTWFSKFISMGEALLGAVLLALIVFVLGRRATR